VSSERCEIIIDLLKFLKKEEIVDNPRKNIEKIDFLIYQEIR